MAQWHAEHRARADGTAFLGVDAIVVLGVLAAQRHALAQTQTRQASSDPQAQPGVRHRGAAGSAIDEFLANGDLHDAGDRPGHLRGTLAHDGHYLNEIQACGDDLVLDLDDPPQPLTRQLAPLCSDNHRHASRIG
jgi:hypothetical protein